MTSLYSSSRAKDLPRFLQGRHQDIHLVGCVVHMEGSSRGGRNPQPPHQDLGAVVARSNAHTILVEHLGQVVRMDVTITPPPPRNGSIRSSRSSLPYRPPDAVGPSILWPEMVKKSMSRSTTFTGLWGTNCAPSTTTTAPTEWAASANRRRGGSVPSTF